MIVHQLVKQKQLGEPDRRKWHQLLLYLLLPRTLPNELSLFFTVRLNQLSLNAPYETAVRNFDCPFMLVNS